MLNAPLVKSPFFWDFELIFETRILQIHQKFMELQAFEVQVCAKAETRGLEMAFLVKAP